MEAINPVKKGPFNEATENLKHSIWWATILANRSYDEEQNEKQSFNKYLFKRNDNGFKKEKYNL